MDAQTLEPKTQTNLTSSTLNWVVRTAAQAYTIEEITGNLAGEISAALDESPIEADPIPSVEPEDFEAAYHWFIS